MNQTHASGADIADTHNPLWLTFQQLTKQSHIVYAAPGKLDTGVVSQPAIIGGAAFEIFPYTLRHVSSSILLFRANPQKLKLLGDKCVITPQGLVSSLYNKIIKENIPKGRSSKVGFPNETYS